MKQNTVFTNLYNYVLLVAIKHYSSNVFEGSLCLPRHLFNQ